MYKQLIQLASIFKEGFTVCINNGVITQFNEKSGYIVSYKTLIKIKDNKVITINNDIPDNCIIGGWYDKDTDTYLIELNIVFNTLRIALKCAKAYNQKCIWDIANNKEIKV